MKLVPKKVFFWSVKNHGSIAGENEMEGSPSCIQVHRYSATCGSVFFDTFLPERCNAVARNKRESRSSSSDNSGLIPINWFLLLEQKWATLGWQLNLTTVTQICLPFIFCLWPSFLSRNPKWYANIQHIFSLSPLPFKCVILRPISWHDMRVSHSRLATEFDYYSPN